jgi:hypothetical protein
MQRPELEAAAPTLLRDYVAVGSFEPNVYYRWRDEAAGLVDEAGGGLNAYQLVYMRRVVEHVPTEPDQLYVPNACVDDGPYDDWGKPTPERIVHLEKPKGLDRLWLPPVLDLVFQHGWLVDVGLLDDGQGVPARALDCFGDEVTNLRAVVLPPAVRLAEAEEQAKRGVHWLVWSPPGKLRPATKVVRRDVVERWQHAGAVPTDPAFFERIPVSTTTFTHLDVWQSRWGSLAERRNQATEP